MKFSFYNFAIFIIFVTSLIINIHEQVVSPAYNSETGTHYEQIIKLREGKLLIDGPLTTHEWLRASSFSYYFLFPLYHLSNYHPATIGYLWAIASGFTSILLYIVISKIFNKRAGLISTFLLAISPNYHFFDRRGGIFMFVVPLTILLAYQLHKIINKGDKKVWIIFFFISVMFTLHASSMILFPFFIFLFLFKKLPRHQIYKILIATLIPQLPLILIDAQKGFPTLLRLPLWMPYKIFNFLAGKSLGPGKQEIANTTIKNILEFITHDFLPLKYPYLLGLFILITYILFAKRQFNRLKKNIFLLILIALYFYGLLALVLHQNVPAHYFVPIFILPYILMGIILSKFNKFLVTLILTILLILNIKNYQIPKDNFAQTKQVSKIILHNNGNKPFSIIRIGNFDFYPDRFQSNYEMMLYWLGNYPKRISNAENIYYIVENNSKLEEIGGEKIGTVENISIFRDDYDKSKHDKFKKTRK